VDEVFRALADPGRRRLLDSLNARDGQSLRELCSGAGVTRQSVSKHLAVLEAAGLVTAVRRGREKLHFLNPVPINAIAERWMDRYHRGRVQALADLKRSLEDTVGPTEFVYVTYIATTPEALWRALTDPEFIRRYFGGGGPESTWEPGAPVYWSMTGEPHHDWDQRVLASEPGRRLSYSWHNYQPEMQPYHGWTDEQLVELRKEPRSTVTFEIEPAGRACRLTVSHTGFVPGSAMLDGVSGGWPEILANLKTLLETGDVLPLEVG
jgi:uncharacterized protein YndB with AHSA1/START domain/DNA-binding transcriptional ArsR family regulator